MLGILGFLVIILVVCLLINKKKKLNENNKVLQIQKSNQNTTNDNYNKTLEN